MIQDSAMAKKKEEVARMEATKCKSEAAELTKHIQKLQETIEELQEKQSESKATYEDAQKSTMEAMLRRLNNERQYLKSQVRALTVPMIETLKHLVLPNSSSIPRLFARRRSSERYRIFRISSLRRKASGRRIWNKSRRRSVRWSRTSWLNLRPYGRSRFTLKGK